LCPWPGPSCSWHAISDRSFYTLPHSVLLPKISRVGANLTATTGFRASGETYCFRLTIIRTFAVMGRNVVGSHATITRQSVLCASCGQCKMLDAAILDVHSESQEIGQLGQASRAPPFVASTSRESHMHTKVPDFAPMRSTTLTCVAATPAFRTVAENAIIFLYATSAHY
jgi:hypothetical protein